MALGVALLRLAMLLLNIYETMKVLKLPRPSARNSGQPTVRALSLRKRNMKGCLAVWIVWCCFMLYERMVERVVSLFIPFYDEFKSLVLLFLIFTRARGAEPIYLHIIRPLLKPYTSTVDALFDITRMFGDIVFVLSTYPFQVVSAWWHEILARFQTPIEDEAPGGLYAEVQQALNSISSCHPPSRRRSSGLPQDNDFAAMTAAQNAIHRPRVSAEGPDPGTRHEIWHPPRSAYQDEDDPTPNVESDESRRAREQADEWRQYPPFPSAYPATPLPAPSTLPSIAPRRFSPIAEDPPELERDFGASLPSLVEPLNRGSFGGASDKASTLRVRTRNGNSALTAAPDSTDEGEDEDEGEEEEEDDFDVTLQTPGPSDVLLTAPMTRSRAKSSSAEPRGEPILPSLLSRLTTDTSVSSASSSASGVGRKRPGDLVASGPVPRGRAAAHIPLLPLEDDSSAGGSSASVSSTSATDDDDDDEDEEGETGLSTSELASPLMRRGRVGAKTRSQPPPRRVQPRRGTRERELPAVAPPPPRRAEPATSSRRRAAVAEPEGPSVAPRPARRVPAKPK
ncbi:hypothetical protein B0H15DRAFT_878478 [Mycena belliarum]|uniref:Protein YOP1 n=1 Tax=Mycena belliarum TaxID=1033014 RepID=A0AAD6XRU1_9AGAR|nr:hypothetical protein B0H15DRAFT_878478 [Mycena belliae]